MGLGTADHVISDGASAYGRRAVQATLWPPTDHLLSAHDLEEIAKRAVAADEQGTLSSGSLDTLRDASYFGLPVPTELHGGGARLIECAAVQRQLGMTDPALAIAVNMHVFSVGMAVEHWLRHHDVCGLLLDAIAGQQRVIASAFAEPGLGGTVLRSNTKAERTENGYLVTGVKTPCSLAAECDLVCLQMEADPPEPEGLLLALIPASSDGVRVARSWDSLGMRGSGSDTLLLERCFVPDELVFHRCRPGFDHDEVFAAGLVWFCVTTTATYLGVVEGAMTAARSGLRGSRLSYLGSSRAELPTVEAQLGELVAGTLTIEAACSALADRLDARACDPRSLLPLAIAIKHSAVEACTRAIEGSAELLGGQSYARRGTLARLWRDVQAVRFHPPTRLASRQILGRWALELPFSFELDERPVKGSGPGLS
jgi:alkylation response protein AidB-like acyl-CoA dehydrogenase